MRTALIRGFPRVGYLLLSLALLPSFALALDVPQWSMYDLNLNSNTSYTNGYASGPTTLSATFTSPGQSPVTVQGFWTGGSSFDFRFAPAAQGTWSYTTSSSDSSLNNLQGSINAIAPTNHGFLRNDASHPTALAWEDGTPYFMWGQVYDNIVQTAMVNNNWKTAIDNSLAHGMTKIRMNVYPDSSSPGWTGTDSDWSTFIHGYAYTAPYTGTSMSPNRDELNFAYWQKLDEVVKYIDSKGMVADLSIANPYNDNNMFGTSAQNDRFVKYAVARYAANHNVMWNVSWEYNISSGPYEQGNRQYQADFNRMGGIVHNNDPWMSKGSALRPLSIHDCWPSRLDFSFFGAIWPTYVSRQYHPTTLETDVWANQTAVSNLSHNMPFSNDEYRYIGLGQSQAEMRHAEWGTAVAGGFGSSGDFTNYGSGATRWIPNLTGEWADHPEYDDIQRMVDFFTTKGIEYWKMSSQNSLTSNARTYILAETSKQYVIYSAAGGTFSVNLPAGTYNAWRFNPRDGSETSLGTVIGGGSQSFGMPDSNDWVVRISAVPEPSALVLLSMALAGLAVRRWRQCRHSGKSRVNAD